MAEKSKKNLNIIIVLVCILVTMGLIYLIFRFTNNDNKSNTESTISVVGTLVVVNPNITVTRNGEQTEVTETEVEVKSGDSVKTNKEGSGYVVFPDGSIILIGLNSEIKISYISNSDEKAITKIELLLGNVWSKVNKLAGKETDYEIQTSNTVAAVRGTEYGCDLLNEDNVVCYVNDGVVEIIFDKNGEENKFQVESGYMFNSGVQTARIGEREYDDYISKFEFSKDNDYFDPMWIDYVTCIDENSDKFSEIDFGLDCREILVSDDYVIDDYVIDTNPYVVLTKEVNNYKCSWVNIDADKYRVSISNDIPYAQVNWIETTENEFYINEGRTISEYYRCNVIPIVDTEEGEMISSEMVYVDFAFANIEDTNPFTNSNYQNLVSFSGIYRNIEISNIMARYYIYDTVNNKYFNGTEWITDKYWFEVELDINDPGEFVYSENIFISYNKGVVLSMNIEVYNEISGRVLDSAIIDNVALVLGRK